ncbi:MAG TPA: SAM-dependent chlorinase/fluorinase [Candidatus Cryosericum sp.]|nr:SAM-dependent chlorinase/fluorinase [Candidatus Cryosericum sp.]
MKPILVFQTDFTYKEGAVSSMYGVVKSVDRELEIMDGTHELPQYDTWSASYRLYQSLRFWPEGTIYVSVVDPGVGTSRRACVAKVKGGYYVVTPDNGALTHIKCEMGILEVREIDESVNRLRGKDTEGVAIFHGRDLFGYCAAKLASGVIDFAGVGPAYPVEEIVTHELLEPTATQGRVEGIFEIDDPNFGNLWTNIPTKLFNECGFAYGEKVRVVITHAGTPVFDQKVLFHQSFGFAGLGEPIIYNNEMTKLALAVSRGSFKEQYGAGFGPDWKVVFSID